MVQQPRAARTRAAIVEAAAAAFAESGFEGATLGSIIARAGVTQGALYFHFASKRDLAAAVMERERELVAEVEERILKPETSALDGLVLLLGAVAELLATDPMMRAGLRLRQGGISEAEGAAGSPWAEVIDDVEALLERAIRERELVPVLPVGRLARFVTTCVIGIQALTPSPNRQEVRERVADAWAVFLAALTPGLSQDGQEQLIGLARSGGYLSPRGLGGSA